MLHRPWRAALAAAAALCVAGIGAGTASAVDPTPSFARCPVADPNLDICVVIQGTAGSMKINNTTVDLGSSIKIEGGLKEDANGVFIQPPTSGSALTATPVNVPGGLLGIPLPLGLDTVKATPVLVGTIRVNAETLDISMPIKIKLDNPLLGPGCQIGASWLPINLNMITGTTSPPSPNTPISGSVGDIMELSDGPGLEVKTTNVDNSFSVPTALNCGWLGGLLITPLVDVKLGLPSSGGHNTIITHNNVFMRAKQVIGS